MQNQKMNEEKARALLSMEPAVLFKRADEMRRERKGDDVQVRALLEFSNYCKRRCAYCGLRCENRSLTRFRLSKEEIIAIGRQAHEAGYQTIVLQSGEDPFYTPEMVGEIVSEIAKTGITITLSCGEWKKDVYRYWHDCGAKRYLLKHETADPALYRSLHPDSMLLERVQCLYDLKETGYETGGGFMIGLPGQTVDTIAKDLALIASIPCDMAGIGPFLPHPQTPLRDAEAGSAEWTLRAVAAARILLPDANLPATTSLGVLDPTQKDHVFACGANVIMQKVTPVRVRALYEIYPANHQKADIIEGRQAVEAQIRAFGRRPV